MKTICFIETDEHGNVEWSEGCVCEDDVYEHSRELIDKKDAMRKIEELEQRISYMMWEINPDKMGA